jgi:hypothetical protein
MAHTCCKPMQMSSRHQTISQLQHIRHPHTLPSPNQPTAYITTMTTSGSKPKRPSPPMPTLLSNASPTSCTTWQTYATTLNLRLAPTTKLTPRLACQGQGTRPNNTPSTHTPAAQRPTPFLPPPTSTQPHADTLLSTDLPTDTDEGTSTATSNNLHSLFT